MFDENDPKRIMNFRPLIFAAVGVLVGILAFEGYISLDLRAPFPALILIFSAGLICALCVYAFIQHKRALFIALSALLLICARMAVSIPKEVQNGVHAISGTVYEIPKDKEGVIILCRASIDGNSYNGRIKLKYRGEGALPGVGDRISFTGSTKKPAARFGSYDERLQLLSTGVSLKADLESFTVDSSGALPLKRSFDSVRDTLKSRIKLIFGENADIVSGFLLGDKSEIGEDETESFRTTGTAHLLTLSGFHVGVITSLLFFVLPKRFPWMRFGIICLFLLSYCAVASFAPSIVRASLMCFCVLLSDAVRRRRDTLSSLSLAAIVILFVSPYMLYSVGFRLSFAATLGILLITSAGHTRFRNPIVQKLVSALLVTLGATCATSLISAQCFGVFPTYGLLANIVAVPLFSIAITACFVLLLLGMPLPGAAKTLAFIPNTVIDAAMYLLRVIGRLPYASIDVVSPSTLSGILMLCVMFAISAYVLRPIGKRLKFAGAVFLVFTASLIADIIIA